MIKRLYNEKISGLGLSIFRIAYTMVLLCEVVQLNYFRHLIFDKIPFIRPAEIDFGIPLRIWMIAIIFIMFGLFTRLATIINYLMTVILVGSITTYEYHMFYAYLGINFLLMFLPISSNLSLDRLLLKYKYSNTRFQYNPPEKISALCYLVPIFVGLAFVYFDSIFYKFTSSYWTVGLGMWYPSSLPFTNYISIPYILDQKYLMLFLGYLTLVFEFIFIFTFFLKKWRIPLLIIGLGLHVGILICYPIPWFGLGMCTIYLLMVPVSWWEKLFKSAQKPALLTFYYDGECPLCNRTKITIQHFDIAKRVDFKTVQYYAEQNELLKDIPTDELLNDIHSVRNGKVYKGLDTYIQVFNAITYLKPLSWILRIPGIYHMGKAVYQYVAKNRNTERCTEENCGYTPPAIPIDEDKVKILQNYTVKDFKISLIKGGLCLVILFQIIVSYNSIKNKGGFENTSAGKEMSKISDAVEKPTKTYLGITHHAVFMDYHFNQYNHIISVIYVDKKGQQVWLPIINNDGTAGSYLHGPTWIKWTFRTTDNIINQDNLKRGIRDFSAFWARMNGVCLKDAKFIIKVKKIDTLPNHWEEGFLKRQMEKPWMDVGVATWHDKKYSIDIKDIESL
ncbi:putative DCC family thiol-disulfide oxidoreductase YuxK [Chryseobacterium sp. 7]|uniref:DCC1-like thiol-disulfide oxidoreductase family protein n=1 Tax=Chryseobacterium sp. 7 TaxID=2035214 RepID=UPI000F15B568|nr:DCC1-like thiol-disulfide oxidoreductase family protein [Chryseobacterium sp. 7]RLJ30909.1 putative DCC family thiol-disulfide oxidoreductase YuxK [Chryseobacterium sp. 7]